MDIFLTSEEIYDLTGYKSRSSQEKWFCKRGWRYEVSALGKIKVLRKYAEMQLGMPHPGEQEATTEPDFSRLAS
jgi:hypothetical protein